MIEICMSFHKMSQIPIAYVEYFSFFSHKSVYLWYFAAQDWTNLRDTVQQFFVEYARQAHVANSHMFCYHLWRDYCWYFNPVMIMQYHDLQFVSCILNWYLDMHFRNEKHLYSDSNFTEFVSKGPIDNNPTLV